MKGVLKMENLPQVNVPMTIKDMKKHVAIVDTMMKEMMIGPTKDNPRGVHYGLIPGCDKPTLLKPGAEKIMLTFHLSPSFQVEDLSSGNIIRYRVMTTIKHRDGTFLGEGVGECSSAEEKYAWRSAVCPEEFNATPLDQRRTKWKKVGYNKKEGKAIFGTVDQVMTNSADIANTILKMAKKRSLIDATLTCTAASDCFLQDVEEMSEELRASVYGEDAIVESDEKKVDLPKEATTTQGQPAPQTASEPPKTEEQKTPKPENAISEKQVGRLLAIAKANGWSADEVREKIQWDYEIGHFDHITKDIYEEVVSLFEVKKEASNGNSTKG